MKIQNIAATRAFKGIEVDYDTSMNISYMADKLAPCQKEINQMNADYYGDVLCIIQEERKNGQRGIGVDITPYEDNFIDIPEPRKQTLLFYPYKNFDPMSFIKNLKSAVQEMSDFVINN